MPAGSEIPPAERRARALDPNAPAAELRELALREPAAVLANPALPLLELAGEWLWFELDFRTFRALAEQPTFPERVAQALLEASQRLWDEGGERRWTARGHWPEPVIENPALPLRLRERLLALWWDTVDEGSRVRLAERIGSRIGPVLLRARWVRKRGLRAAGPPPLAPEEYALLRELGGYAHTRLAGHPDCPAHLALELLDSPNAGVRALAAQRPACAAEAARRYLAAPAPELARGLAQNPAAPVEALAALAELEKLPTYFVDHPALTPEILARLAERVGGDVYAIELLRHPNLPPALRARLQGKP